MNQEQATIVAGMLDRLNDMTTAYGVVFPNATVSVSGGDLVTQVRLAYDPHRRAYMAEVL